MRPIWFGGTDRSEASMDEFFAWLGPKKCRRIQLAVMDMWKPFRNSTKRHAPHANILFDKFHIMRHLGDALDTVRKREYARVSGNDRRFIKGRKYTRLSHRENLTLDGRRALKQLLAANKRLNTAYLLKEAFGQLWDYRREGWARRFFENWRAALKWQRLKPYEKFAELIERHWDGIAAYCHPENKVSLGFVEGLNNKIRVIQRLGLRAARRGVSATEGPDLHVAQALRSPARASGPGAYQHPATSRRLARYRPAPPPPRLQRAESSKLQKRLETHKREENHGRM
jgi:transposase